MLDLTGRNWEEESKKPDPSNERLRELFRGVDKIVIKDDGVYNDKAVSDKILLTIVDETKIIEFQNLLEIDERNIGFYCMCLGSHAIELYSKGEIRATIGFHHASSIRCGRWNSDAALAKTDALACFLYEAGLEAPLLEKIRQRKEHRQYETVKENWLLGAPACFTKYWDEMNGFDEDFLPALIEDLNKEQPDKSVQIIELLQLFGLSTNFWTGYPVYEDVPFTILQNYPVPDIIDAYNGSNKNIRLQRGLGRFLCCFKFGKIRSRFIKHIPQNVIDEIKRSFQLANDSDGLHRIDKLQAEKDKS